jgi:hypothetical protein
MTRKGPTASATIFPVGTEKKGNDGNKWGIVKNKNGVKRWQKLSSKVSSKVPKIKTKKRKIIGSDKKRNMTIKDLNLLKKKYQVSSHGNKKEIALGLWRVRGSAMNDNDLEKIVDLLPSLEKKRVVKLLSKRETQPITNYKGLWKPQPKPLSQMKRAELIKNLQGFRDAWERTTTRNADLGDSRLEAESTENLRELIKWHYSDEAKQLAGDWLRK